MDSTDFEDTLTNQEQQLVASIDEQLRAALAVEPSADFAARLRSRIAQSPRAARGWSRWWMPAAAAAAAAIALAAAVAVMNRTEAPPFAVPAVAVAPVPSVAATPATPVERVVSERVAVQKPRLSRSSGSRTEAEIQVAPGQEEGLRHFLALVNQGRIDPASVPSVVDPSEARVVTLIQSTIVPVTIEPLFPVPAGEKADPTVKEE